MAYKEQLRRWEEYASRKSISKVYYSTPLDRGLRKLGLRARPFLLWSVISTWIVMALLFGLGMVILFSKPIWLDRPNERRDALIMSVLAGLGFGLWVSLRNRRIRLRHKIPCWSDFERDIEEG